MTNLSISPAKLEIQLKPGSNYLQSFLIKNNSDQVVSLYSSVESWIPQGSEGNIAYINETPKLDLSLSNSNIQLNQTFTINPHQSQQLVLKIQVPYTINNGDQYLTLFINQDNLSNLSTNSTQLIRIGSHLLISVTDSENVPAKLTINNFQVSPILIDSFFSKITFLGEMFNPSDFFVKVDDTILIKKNNIEVNKLLIFPDNILANHSRKIRCLNDNLPINCEIQNPQWPGMYQATLANKTINYLVFPYSLLILSIVLAVFIKIIIDNHKRNQL